MRAGCFDALCVVVGLALIIAMLWLMIVFSDMYL